VRVKFEELVEDREKCDVGQAILRRATAAAAIKASARPRHHLINIPEYYPIEIGLLLPGDNRLLG
jgi:hypothetical protein